jgi:6-hydroxycyclohex-1-ene-1-carbonyl-CoA dehydrogenase
MGASTAEEYGVRVAGWVVSSPGAPMAWTERDDVPGDGDAIVAVAGCGVCHTDLGFYYDGVPTRHGFPLVLGHEIAGTVVAAGRDATAWIGREVVVPAVIPCGRCAACRAGRGAVCPDQVFPGSDVHGGFGSHVRVPAHGLCRVPDLSDPAVNPARHGLADLAVIADAISTPYQAIQRSGLEPGDLAVFVGAGGVGGFGVQLAAAAGAHVIAIDVDDARLATMRQHGAALTLQASAQDAKALKAAVRRFAADRAIPSWRQRIFETSGSPAGQVTAFSLLAKGAYLSIVGYTAKKIEIHLSSVMAFDATVQGNWACLPEHYPAIVELALSGEIAIAPFVERRPMTSIHETFAEIHARGAARRVILVPER